MEGMDLLRPLSDRGTEANPTQISLSCQLDTTNIELGESATLTVFLSTPGNEAHTGTLEVLVGGDVAHSREVGVIGDQTADFAISPDSGGSYPVEARIQ